ncbi:hypothetical protein TSAR_005962 [Trichomalopsis sarcophagae]|uniref:Endonuclease/exonuclease/phosphatase domain-containing protein n=1 Tax=Trichomalopsis sarcophagae TaxID=543379 RepID=A0A232EW64_9HYME|nr:hypothetical protein TSAR_005962 [Trichomalopsis sarcophagae]
MKSLIKEKDRDQRKIINGAGEILLSDLKDWTTDFLLNRLKVQVEVTSVRPAGKVIVAHLGSVKDKKLVMQNNSKLAGSKIFIENDLSYEERKLQEDINRWVKGQRELGRNVRAGFGRVWIEGKSMKWDEAKQESERRHIVDDDKHSSNVDAEHSNVAAGHFQNSSNRGLRTGEVESQCGQFRFIFLNVAGATNKDRNFWEFIEKFDSIKEKGWELFSKQLNNNFVWDCIPAIRVKKVGRAKGGFVIGIKKKWLEVGSKVISEVKKGIVKYKIVRCGEITNDLEFIEEGKLIIGWGFNIRTGKLGKFIGIDKNDDNNIITNRRSKDRIIGNEGRYLIETIEGKGWIMLNGVAEGDDQGEFTYIGARGHIVIDYVIVNAKFWNNYVQYNISVITSYIP